MYKYIFLISLLIITSCSISSIPLTVTRPADIDVPNNIKNVLVLNRSLPSKGNQAENILDGILSGETIGLDKYGSEECILGFEKTISSQPDHISRFNILSIDYTTQNLFKGTGTSELPKPIKWKKIEKLKKNYDFDGLIVLETFDSKSRIINAGVVERVFKIKGEKTKKKLIEAVLEIEVEAGWRIYDFMNKNIVDQNIFIDKKGFSSTGVTFELAKNKLPQKRDAILTTGQFAGTQYAARIAPKIEKVTRTYYTKVKKHKSIKKDFKTASHLFKNKNITAAAKIWNNYTNHNDINVASKACFNMSVCAELKNKYKLAINWIEKSIKFNADVRAIRYLEKLKFRIKELERVEQQLKD